MSQDTSLLAKIKSCDLTLEAKYHIKCLTEIQKHHRSIIRECNYASSHLHEKEQMKARAGNVWLTLKIQLKMEVFHELWSV